MNIVLISFLHNELMSVCAPSRYLSESNQQLKRSGTRSDASQPHAVPRPSSTSDDLLPVRSLSHSSFSKLCLRAVSTEFASAIIDHALIDQEDVVSLSMSAASQQEAAILQLPALAPPPGVIPNFTNPKNIGPRLIILGAVLLTFVIIAIANRAYTKLCIVRKMSLDDFTISLAVLGAIASYGLCVYGNQAIGFHSDQD